MTTVTEPPTWTSSVRPRLLAATAALAVIQLVQ
jgi:hypothetical protein